jgi:hypothetical protein
MTQSTFAASAPPPGWGRFFSCSLRPSKDRTRYRLASAAAAIAIVGVEGVALGRLDFGCLDEMAACLYGPKWFAYRM